jgi:response regulator of citrate/malate metabolism
MVTQPAKDYSVLVVDDDFMVARIHTHYLATVPGFRVVATVHTGAEALSALKEFHPELMLLDVYLPDMTGIEVLRRARQEFPDVDVIVVTAARELDTVREAMQGGAVSYLIKPFEYQALGERLEHYRRTRSALDTSSHADQQQIDQLFGLRSATSADDLAGLPKGLSRETAQAVLAILSRDEAISATECAERIGLSRVSARRYLEHLEQTGVAQVALKYGVGRPERRYRLR